MSCVVILIGVAGLAVAGEASDADGRESLRVVSSDETGIVFSSWLETGHRWAAVSKDDGQTWSEPRAMIDTLPLQAGVIVPGSSLPAVPKNTGAWSAVVP